MDTTPHQRGKHDWKPPEGTSRRDYWSDQRFVCVGTREAERILPVAAVAHNLDHIASASTKPGTEAGKAIMHGRERGRMARMKTREIPWSGQ
jgi:hypothetical protein